MAYSAVATSDLGVLFSERYEHDLDLSRERRLDDEAAIASAVSASVPFNLSGHVGYGALAQVDGDGVDNDHDARVATGADGGPGDDPRSLWNSTSTVPILSPADEAASLHRRPSTLRSRLKRSPQRASPPSPVTSVSSAAPATDCTVREANVEHIVRTASGRQVDLRHPTPGLQTLQGAYMSNVEHLEKTAERLSMTSSIEDAIRDLHDQQKRSDSRKSSLLNSPIDVPGSSRQSSNPSSIVEVNTAARAGGYSPGGFSMLSPIDGFHGVGRVRSVSKPSSKLGVPDSQSTEVASMPNGEENGPELVLASAGIRTGRDVWEESHASVGVVERSEGLPMSPSDNRERPSTSASATTIEHAQPDFSDFDGEHNLPRAPSLKINTQPHLNERLQANGASGSTRPQSYADPGTGQQMVYYPAPVPMMLNLPKKLSTMPSGATREKRRSQVLSTIPLGARQSAIWLPDVLEDENDESAAADDGLAALEYIPQHQRRTMGGRRTATDLHHLPPQLRASVFFDPPSIQETVEVKGESAVKTLDSILDASAFAPVSAFTDHAFAGKLGAEVYGTNNKSVTKSRRQVLDNATKNQLQSPTSATILRRSSSIDLSRATAAPNHHNDYSDSRDIRKFGKLSGSGDETDDVAEVQRLTPSRGMALTSAKDHLAPSDDDEEIYLGAPTTLLAELQLRKQNQKLRTKPRTSLYPNGTRSTLLELDAVAQVEKKSRGQKRVNLAWEDVVPKADLGNGEDDDVPLAMLFPSKSRLQQVSDRPMGLMESRAAEDNEPLSRRRNRLLGLPAAPPRASTTMSVRLVNRDTDDEVSLQDDGPLPTARPVSGAFSSELMSPFGGDAHKEAVSAEKAARDRRSGTPVLEEEEETLGQRRKRLQAERGARDEAAGQSSPAQEQRPAVKSRRSMADILHAHPSAHQDVNGLSSRVTSGFSNVPGRQSVQQASMRQSYNLQQAYSQGFGVGGVHNDMFGGVVPASAAYPYTGYLPPGAYVPQLMGYNSSNMMDVKPGGRSASFPLARPNPMAASMMQMSQAALNQKQMEIVERWRQSVMQ